MYRQSFFVIMIVMIIMMSSEVIKWLYVNKALRKNRYDDFVKKVDLLRNRNIPIHVI